jgi:hypothetical protein
MTYPRIAKPVHNMQTGARLLCCASGNGDTCERQGYDLYKLVVRSGAEQITYVFCSDSHRDFFLHSHLAFGKLPPGGRRRVL